MPGITMPGRASPSFCRPNPRSLWSMCAAARRGRETDALDPTCLIDAVHAVVLSGGSAFGLDPAGTVAAALGARGIGFAVGGAGVPIVLSAITLRSAQWRGQELGCRAAL